MFEKKKIHKITFIGSGNIAWHLALGLKTKGFELVEVFSVHSDKREKFAINFGCTAVEKIEKINKTSELYIIAIPDKEIEKLILTFPEVEGIVVHTSGITSIQVLNKFKNFGVFYPLQTFTKDVQVRFNNVPFCIEASDKQVEETLLNLGSQLSEKVQLINSEQRKNLHLSAVLVSNFANLLYIHSHDFLEKKGLDFHLLLPLIEETSRKILLLSPRTAQTGPARRNDQTTLEEHTRMLSDFPEIQELYVVLSEQIRKKYNE